MIKKVLGKLKKVFIPRSEFIDDDPKKVEKSKPSYIGVVAPIVAPFDNWFSKPVRTEKQREHLQQEAQERLHEDLRREHENRKEPPDIHQKMYEMATRSGSTTLQLNPIGGSENFQGGSENFHER